MTDQPQPRPPLWREMDIARIQASDGEYIDGEWVYDTAGMTAAEIRAVADWLVPEEPPIPPGALERVDAFDNPDLYDQLEVGRALARLDLRQLLLDEAQRAEAGRDNPFERANRQFIAEEAEKRRPKQA